MFTFDDYTLLPGLDDAIQAAWGPFPQRTPDFAEFYRVAAQARSWSTDTPSVPRTPACRTAGRRSSRSTRPRQDRTDAYAAYVGALHQAPWVVGDFWFEYTDEPAGGRFDTEDSNFGVVSTADVPWQTLVDRMTAVHARSQDR